MKNKQAKWTREMRMIVFAHYLKYGTSLKKSTLDYSLPLFRDEFISNGGNPEKVKSSFNFKLGNFRAIDPTHPGKGMTGFQAGDQAVFDYYYKDSELLKAELDIDRISKYKSNSFTFDNSFDDIDSGKKSNKKFVKQETALLEEIGNKGEEYFNDNLNNGTFDDVIDLLDGISPKDFIWVNENGETGEPFDFKAKKYIIDVKTTISNSNGFHLSSAEKKLLDNDQLYILKIWMNKNYEYQKHSFMSPTDVKNSYNLKPTKFIAYKK